MHCIVVSYHVIYVCSNDSGCVMLMQRVMLWLPSTEMAVLHMSTTQ